MMEMTIRQRQILRALMRAARGGREPHPCHEPYQIREVLVKQLGRSTVSVFARRIYFVNGEPGNGLNDTAFHAIIGPRGGVRGTHYPSCCGRPMQKFNRRSLWKIAI